MEKIFLSIIVPVYKVEKYLVRCIESLLDQKQNCYEVILVDDGSPDNCGEICDRYANEYEHIISLHKENGGLSDARNFGLKYASGEYIWFVDSDDYVEKDSVNCVISDLKENQCDVLVCQSKKIEKNGVIKDECMYTIPKGLYSTEEYLLMLKKHPESVLFCAQFHICKKSFLEKNELFFYKGILHEDELWTPQVLLCAKSIFYSGENLYFHYMRDGSIMNSSNLEKSGKSDLIVTTFLKDIYNNTEMKNIQYLKDHMADTYLQAVWKIPGFFNLEIWKRWEPLKNSYYIKTRLKSFLYFVSPKLYLLIHKITKKF